VLFLFKEFAELIWMGGFVVFDTVSDDVVDETFVEELFNKVVDGGAVELCFFFYFADGNGTELKES
jgi:hypothetical protein